MANDTPSGSTVSAPGRRGRRGMGLLLLVVVLIAIGLFIWAEQQRRTVSSKLEQTEAELEEIRKSTQRGGEEVAKEVLTKVRSHMIVPEEPQPTVATIIDINRLKEASEFYAVADNGDHLIITEKRAILYDPDRDIILDVVPVRINKTSASPGVSPGRTSPSPTSTPSPTPTK
ncbi:MAG: hypothetical protein AAB538_04065 [Patescibacteria group bacterium]